MYIFNIVWICFPSIMLHFWFFNDLANMKYSDYMLSSNQLVTSENEGLFHAALAGSISEVLRLLKLGAKPNYFCRAEDNKNSLHIASERGFTEIVKLLIEHGADVNSIAVTDQSSALVLAAHNENPELIQLLVDNGAKIDSGTCSFMFVVFDCNLRKF